MGLFARMEAASLSSLPGPMYLTFRSETCRYRRAVLRRVVSQARGPRAPTEVIIQAHNRTQRDYSGDIWTRCPTSTSIGGFEECSRVLTKLFRQKGTPSVRKSKLDDPRKIPCASCSTVSICGLDYPSPHGSTGNLTQDDRPGGLGRPRARHK